jgi:hypothetical protein
MYPMTRERFNPTLNAKNLPPELVKELNLTNNVEDQVLEVFREGGGTLNVSEVLVGFFQLFNELKTRRNMTTILYRMKTKGLLSSTGKKGEYSTV